MTLSRLGGSLDNAFGAVALGVSIGSLFWGLLTGAALTALVAAYASTLVFIKIIGGLYLLWLGFRAFRSAACPRPIETRDHLGPQSAFPFFMRGLIAQMTNPKAALAWIALMSLGLQADPPWWVIAVIIAGTTFLSVVGHLLYALAFSTERIVLIYRRARRSIDLALGTFFCFAGIKLLTSRT
ncbi:LysE family transporter [Bradyrhizobium vignae]|uniref:LysE family transporter n=1 Tax=Bradyrhizobium vignae TaxID=1549949 RepID=A0ABS4A6I8_9BRAD|nr:LysE family transporter [Bradyrhizobium vignae]